MRTHTKTSWSPDAWITPAERSPGNPAEERGGQPRPTWWLRREIELVTVPESLILEIVCLGYYELYVNGGQAEHEPLAPSISRLDRRGIVIAHDIASYLRTGKNCLGIWCSSGWYLPHQFNVHEGETPLLGLRLRPPQDFAAVAETEWLCRSSNRCVIGPWAWNNFGGEEVDAQAAVPDWNGVDADIAGWRPARTVSPPPIEIVERTCPPNRIGESYPVQALRTLGDQCFEVDFGTCLSGWVDVRFRRLLEAGQSVTLRFYDLPADNDRDRDHSYGQISVYHARGDGNDRFTNKFNYAGFRYMTIEGLDQPPDLEDMRAMLVECALSRAGHFQCSNDLYNRIHALNVQTLRCLNLGGYSVDCPHRERNGYGADGQTALPGYLYLFDSGAFLHKWLLDWCDVQDPKTGRIPLCAPTYHAQHAPAWGGIVVPLAWSLYVYYGDLNALKKAFPVVRDYLRFLQAAVREGVMRKDLLGSVFHADWVSPRRGMDTANKPDIPMRELFNSCYLICLWQIFVKICRVLGRDAEIPEAQQHIAVLREGVHREFYDSARGLYLLPEQAYQAMPLLSGVVSDDLFPGVREKLLELIEEKGWHMDTGLPGTTLLLELLTQLDEHEAIARIYNQESYPSWGYMLSQGATTIWEQWNGFWSQIHSCFGGPAAWFYEGLAGIRPDPSGPGFKRIVIKPAVVEGLDWVNCSYQSIAGRIVSNWKRNGPQIDLEIEVPPGCTATVHVPASRLNKLTKGNMPVERADGVTVLGTHEKEVILQLGSGHFHFRSAL